MLTKCFPSKDAKEDAKEDSFRVKRAAVDALRRRGGVLEASTLIMVSSSREMDGLRRFADE